MRLHRREWLAAGAAAVAGLAWPSARAQSPVPVAETSDGGGPGGGTFFVIETVNGERVKTNAIGQSLMASAGRGAYMVVRPYTQAVPAGRVKLGLLARQEHAAPIAQIFVALFKGGAPEAKGEVEVELQAGKRYRVNGVLEAMRREVWIQDDEGKVVPGSLVSMPPDPELVKAMEGAVYTATNLRYEGDWISDASMPHLPAVPLGSRIKLVEFGRNRAAVLIDGRRMRVGVDYARGVETIEAMFARITTAEDPRPRLAAAPELVRQAVRAARVVPGMTREQVLWALGRPRVDRTPTIDAPEWNYQVPDNEEAFAVFGSDGLLREIDGSRKARGFMVFQPPAGSGAAAAAAPAPAPAVPAPTAGAVPSPQGPASAASAASPAAAPPASAAAASAPR